MSHVWYYIIYFNIICMSWSSLEFFRKYFWLLNALVGKVWTNMFLVQVSCAKTCGYLLVGLVERGLLQPLPALTQLLAKLRFVILVVVVVLTILFLRLGMKYNYMMWRNFLEWALRRNIMDYSALDVRPSFLWELNHYYLTLSVAGVLLSFTLMNGT